MSCGGTGVCHTCEGTGERDLKSHYFDADGEKLTVFIHCASEWYAQTDADWIQLSQSYGAGNCTLTITVPENPSIERREGVINFISGNSTITVEVGQFAQAIKLNVEPSTIYVQCYGSGEDIHVESNTSWTITAADPWITCSPSSGNGNATIKVSASGYYEGTRYTTLTFTDASGEISKEVVAAQALYQGAVGIYSPHAQPWMPMTLAPFSGRIYSTESGATLQASTRLSFCAACSGVSGTGWKRYIFLIGE